jgi:hypothetical protein
MQETLRERENNKVIEQLTPAEQIEMATAKIKSY